MRLASGSGRIRKSPRNHRVVGEFIRNPALRLTASGISHISTGNRKERKRTKKKENYGGGPLTFFQTPYRESNYKGNLSGGKP